MNSHGYLEFTWKSNILYVEAFGPFNEEGAIDASQEYLEKTKNNGSSNYSIIEIWDENSLGSPIVMEKIANMWRTVTENNCTSIAIVVSNSVQRSLCEKLLPVIGRVFTKMDDAEIWTLENTDT
jgi:hypothetical protein